MIAWLLGTAAVGAVIVTIVVVRRRRRPTPEQEALRDRLALDMRPPELVPQPYRLGRTPPAAPQRVGDYERYDSGPDIITPIVVASLLSDDTPPSPGSDSSSSDSWSGGGGDFGGGGSSGDW